ncbi:PREDICTED: uncharacterized protein LOC106110789, partial [Papilio polytes]|uniref:uncharacterized protein LOC106110789 n=1 Tax=Papilio polytes TaxID=76194 RepID=UPI00067613F6
MEQANRLVSLQEDRIEQIQEAQTNYLKTPKSRITLSYIETRLETLEHLYCSLTKGHEEISTLILRGQRGSVDYFSLDKCIELDELYTIYKTSLKEKIVEINKELTTSNALSPRTSTSTEIKLPTIQIPIFAGSYTDWPSFRDLFTSIVHKNTTLVSPASSTPCTFCDGEHYIFQCYQFVRLNLEQRTEFVKEDHL